MVVVFTKLVQVAALLVFSDAKFQKHLRKEDCWLTCNNWFF